MTRSPWRLVALAAVTALGVQGCREQRLPTEETPTSSMVARVASAEQPNRYLVVFTGDRVAQDFDARVSRLGGSVETSLDSIGVATVTGLTPSAAAALSVGTDIQAVEPDRLMDVHLAGADAGGTFDDLSGNATVAVADAAASPTAAQYYARQWNMRAIFADQAWAAGYLGSHDVRVAILDTGLDYTLQDFDGLIDIGNSKSFVPEEDPVVSERYPGRLPISDLNSHGTAMASIIGSNGSRLAAVNQNVTMIAVKVWNRYGEGSFARFLSGLLYATDLKVDVINVSGFWAFDKAKDHGIVAAANRAANYAFRNGAVLVSVAGNDASDLDHNGSLVVLPCQAAHVICASATGPTANSGVNGPWENVDASVTLYSSYGRSAIDVAAPGGTGDFADPTRLQFGRIWTLCTTTNSEASFRACLAGRPIAQPFGTSLSAAHVSGLAALLVAQLGHGKPASIRERIIQSADDLGEPGTDPYYGKGRINVARALGVIP